MTQNSHGKTRRMVGLSLFTALVVILQLLGSFIRFGPFSISLVALPIVVGSALYGAWAGVWLGFVFGMTVLLSGDAAAFLAVSVFGTLCTVLVKGVACGAAAGLVYKLIAPGEWVDTDGDGVKEQTKSFGNATAAAVASAIVCPVVNTGVFLIGCLLFFMPTISQWAAGMGFENVGTYMILGLVGGNFLVELGTNVLLCPVILRLIKLGRKDHRL